MRINKVLASMDVILASFTSMKEKWCTSSMFSHVKYYFIQIMMKEIAGREGKGRISQLFERFQSGSGKVLLKITALSPV